SFQPFLIAGKKGDWDYCKDKKYVPNGPIEKCASDINQIHYYQEPFNLIKNALRTLCRTESRLTRYQCSDGKFHLPEQMTDKKMILMPATPEWRVRFRYSPFSQSFKASKPESRSPGAQLLNAVGGDKLKRLYQKRVRDTQYKVCDRFSNRKCEISYDHKYLGQIFTHTDDLEHIVSGTRVDLDEKDYIFVLHKIDKFSQLLRYDLHSREGASNTHLLISDGNHFIRVHPRGKTASTWVLNYNGQLSYNCIAGGGSRVQRCSSELNQTEQTWTVTLGETRFQFPVPTPDTPYRVIVQDASARFEWGAVPDLKVIHQLYLNSDLDKKPLRAPTLRGIIAVQPAASRFLPLELQRCDASFLARCMANAPAQWLTYYVKPPRQTPWRMNSAHDPSPMHNNPPPKVMQNPAWSRHRERCQREAEVYRNTPYSCFPDKLGLAEANWAKLDRVKLWFDTHHNAEIQLITPSD
ncbi:hypothetical protein, partial [Endozoicomonas sp. ISHI1]|uniref:hypothetical protein n=1 Tax=Endozoicomonas sp. ISHI1 TaxID=2825882 RepID=UPI0021483144